MVDVASILLGVGFLLWLLYLGRGLYEPIGGDD